MASFVVQAVAHRTAYSFLAEAISSSTDGLTLNDLKYKTSDYFEILDYVTLLCLHAGKRNDWDDETWRSMIVPYVTTLPSMTSEAAAHVASAYQDKLASLLDDSYSDNEVDPLDVCNIKFNLAYGGKILLHSTKLRLKRGHRYGLVGRNGCGKTTLMTAINNGKLEGWPDNVVTFYVDSGSNVDNDFEEFNVTKYLSSGNNSTEEKAKALLGELRFTEEMMSGKIGELSGGWQMKVRLCAAVLSKADILLLDEPTNHLDTNTVKWLENYLKGLSDTTVITVSHDTTFMENTCSDIIHYEKRDGWFHNKLVNYFGTMSAFVEKQPQAKHYFELASSELKVSHLIKDVPFFHTNPNYTPTVHLPQPRKTGRDKN